MKQHFTKLRRRPRTRRSDRRAAAPSPQAILPFHEETREALVATLRGAVLETAQQLVEDEVATLVGPMWSRKGTPRCVDVAAPTRGCSSRASPSTCGGPVCAIASWAPSTPCRPWCYAEH